ncbi:MAG TPA: DUF2282 domain-containing protein [Dongiaceae bacterium]|jgi:uncharacterized membrane protein|nr:DUF2282 domain-containing protein [Dongiaceae bacterium]
MTKSEIAITACGALALAWLVSPARAQEQVQKPTYESEKCYGVSAAGQNDCFTASGSCGKTQEKDRDGAYWVYVPQGTCAKLAGGTLQPK